jgi:hypothetical protein
VQEYRGVLSVGRHSKKVTLFYGNKPMFNVDLYDFVPEAAHTKGTPESKIKLLYI